MRMAPTVVVRRHHADSLQPLLQPFERVARVRAVLSQNDFRKWLHLANDELDGRTPFGVIREGKLPPSPISFRTC